MSELENSNPEINNPDTKKKTWLKRIGVAGFLFFLIKGIVWLFVFYYGVKISGCN